MLFNFVLLFFFSFLFWFFSFLLILLFFPLSSFFFSFLLSVARLAVVGGRLGEGVGSTLTVAAPTTTTMRWPRSLACGALLCPAPISRRESYKFLLDSSNSSPSSTGGHRQKHRCTPQPQSSITIEPHSTNPTVPNKSSRSYPLPQRKMGQDRVSLVIALVLVSLLAAGLLFFGYILIRIAVCVLYPSL
jgi:hypothetical protein